MRSNGAFQSSQAIEGTDGKSRGSKQKIIQLKDELNGGSLQINPKFEKLKVLRESYDIAKFRANELLLPHDQNLYLKAHGLRASKIYSALSTLIFVSISCSKVEELEEYVMKSAAQVPSTIFDLEEWSSIVKIAKDCREGDSNSLREQVSSLKKNMSVYNQLAANPLKAAQMELKLLRSEVINELGGAQADLAVSINLIMQLAKELSGGTGSDIGESARRLSQLLHATETQDRKTELANAEELEALRVFQKNALVQVEKLAGETTELHSRLKAATVRADSAETQNKKLVEHVGDLAKEIDAVKAAAAASPRHISSEQQAQQARDFQELYEQYSHLSATLQQRDQQISDLENQIKGGSLKKRMDEGEPEETAPPPTPQAQIDLENQVSALTHFVTELEHDMLKGKEKIKSLSTEVRLTEAARCEAASCAETATLDLGYAREDIFSLQAEVAALRAALHVHNSHASEKAVSVPKGVSPRASSPLGSFSSMLRIDTRRASFDTIVEVKEEDEVVNTITADDVSLVTEAPLETPVITPIAASASARSTPSYSSEAVSVEPEIPAVLGERERKIITFEAEHTASSAIFIGKVQVALLLEEFAHHPPHITPAVEQSVASGTGVKTEDVQNDVPVAEEEQTEILAVEATDAAVAPQEEAVVVEVPQTEVPVHAEIMLAQEEEDAQLIAEEASRLAASALFLGTVHVAVMQEEFAHHPPSLPQSSPPVEEEVAVSAPTEVVKDATGEEEIPLETVVASELDVPIASEDSAMATSDAQIISAEATRVAASAVFLGAVRVAVLKDEFAHHAPTESETTNAPPTLLDNSAVLADGEASNVAVEPESVAVDSSASPESHKVVEAVSEFVEDTPQLDSTADAHIIAAEAAHTAASALFLGTVHVAVMQEEFHHKPLASPTHSDVPPVEVIAADEPKPLDEAVITDLEPAVTPDIPPPESTAVVPSKDADKLIIADEAAKLVNTTVFLGAVHVAVMQDEFSHHPAVLTPVPTAEPNSAKEVGVPSIQAPAAATVVKQESVFNLCASDGNITFSGKAIPNVPQSESDVQIIANEAARTVASSVFLGAMHVAVMQDEFSHLPPHHTADEAVADKLVDEIVPDLQTEASLSNDAPVDTSLDPVELSPVGATEEDSRIIAEEATRAAASALFLGSVHVAVMQEEFAHHPPQSVPPVEENVSTNAPEVVALEEENVSGAQGSIKQSETPSTLPKEKQSVKQSVEAVEAQEITSPASVARVASDAAVDVSINKEKSLVDSEPLVGALPEATVLSNEEIVPESSIENVLQGAQEVETVSIEVGSDGDAAVSQSEPAIVFAKVDAETISAKQTSSSAKDDSNLSAVVPTVQESVDEVSTPWTITATKDSQQGKSGWYNDKEQLFYYCADKGEPVLLCGPVEEEVYTMALAAEDSATEGGPHPTNIIIDRLGVRATRLQAEFLREEVLNLEQKHSQAINELEQARALTEAELYDCQATVQTLNEEIAQCKDIIHHLESHRRRSQLSYAATEQIKAKIAKLTIEQGVALIKLTSMARGFIGRARVKRIHTSMQAQEAGLLYAMANTKQGESGWYMGPKRNIFYFAQKNGAWTNVAGPLTEEDFELMVLARKQKQVSNSQEVLTLCRVKLQPAYESLVEGGELYVANVTDKVYVCRPLDSIIAESGGPIPVPEREEQAVPTPLVLAEEPAVTPTQAVVEPETIPEDQAILRQESAEDIQAPALSSIEDVPTVRLKSATERTITFSERASVADAAVLHSSDDADDAKTAQEGRWQ